mgnify:CR=1 FL=1
MLFDLFAGIIFVACAYLLWVRVIEKVPELMAIPDSVIAQRLKEDSMWIHRAFLHLAQFRELYRARHYQHKFWRALSKAIWRIHILLLRLDNAILNLLKRMMINTHNGENSAHSIRQNGSEYWKQLTSWGMIG